jgi:RND family efflux transporter MFP subunit
MFNMALKKILRPRYIIILIILLAIGGYVAAMVFGFGEAQVEYDTVTAYRGNLVQTVDVTGTVRAMAEVDLSFESSGTLASTTVEIGDFVQRGDILAELDNENLQYEADQTKATLDLAKANLNLKIVGEASQSINVSAADVAKAEASLRSAAVNLDKAEKDLVSARITTQDNVDSAELSLIAAQNTLKLRQESYSNTETSTDANIDDAYEDMVVVLKNSLSSMTTALSDMDDILGVDDTTVNADFKKYLGILNQQSFINAKIYYTNAKEAKDDAYNAINLLYTDSDHAEVWLAVPLAEDAMNEVHKALTETRFTLDNTITGSGLTSTELSAMKSIMDADLSTVNSRLTSLISQKQVIQNLETSNNGSLNSSELLLTTAEDAYSQALLNFNTVKNTSEITLLAYETAVETAKASRDISKASLDASKAAYDLKVANPRGVDLAPLQAQVKSAEAAYNMSLNRLDNSRIIAPANGIVTKINYEVGEQVSVGSMGGVMTMLATDLFDVEVDIPETDIIKISVGDPAEITLDAFGDETMFSGEVIGIEPAETLIQDVVYYRVKVKIEFTTEQAVKNGMTADVVIKTEERGNALIVPQRAIIVKNGNKIIRVLVNGNIEERTPTVGLRGDGGFVEILSGINEGDEVITAIREE